MDLQHVLNLVALFLYIISASCFLIVSITTKTKKTKIIWAISAFVMTIVIFIRIIELALKG